MVDLAVPDVPATRLAHLIKQRRLLRYAELARSPPPAPVRVPAVDGAGGAAAEAAAQAEAEAVSDDEDADEPHREEKLSDLGLLRSFYPVAQEALPGPGHTSDLAKQLQNATAEVPPEVPRSASAADSERIAKAQRKQAKARKALIHQLSWTPNHAFARASARPAFTDVGCLLPMLLLWLVMIAIGILGGEYGHPPRLFYGVDYELNTCGVANSEPYALRFAKSRDDGFPYAVHLRNARFASSVPLANRTQIEAGGLTTGSRDLSGSSDAWYRPRSDTPWLLAYADPSSRLGICVSACPNPPSVAGGGEPAHQLCTYGATATAGGTSGCYPSYASVAVQGYCVPSGVAPQSAYDAAAVGLDAAALTALQSELLGASGRYFDATFGDVLLMWPLLLGIPLVVVLLALGSSLGATYAPSESHTPPIASELASQLASELAPEMMRMVAHPSSPPNLSPSPPAPSHHPHPNPNPGTRRPRST